MPYSENLNCLTWALIGTRLYQTNGQMDVTMKKYDG